MWKAALGVLLCLGVAVAAPDASPSASPAPSPGVSGTIRKWTDGSFELQPAKGRPWKFHYTKSTGISGTPANGAKANVLFVDQKGSHWATTIKVNQ